MECNGKSFPFETREHIVIPARSRTQSYVIAANPEIRQGYVPRLRVQGTDGVYLGDALVTVTNGKAYLDVINTNDRDIEIIVPKVKIQEVSYISETNKISKFNIEEETISSSLLSINLEKEQDTSKCVTEGEALHKESRISTVQISNSYPLTGNDSKLTVESKTAIAEVGTQISVKDRMDQVKKFHENLNLEINSFYRELREGDDVNHFSETVKIWETKRQSDKYHCFPVSKLEDIERAAGRIESLLRLNHLNSEERGSVNQLIREYSDCFHIPGESLGFMTVTRTSDTDS